MFCEHEAYEKAMKYKALRRKKIILAKKLKFKRWLDYYKIGDVIAEECFKEVKDVKAKRS